MYLYRPYFPLPPNHSESVATLPPFVPIEGQKWFFQISIQWESQKKRFVFIFFGKIQFLPACICRPFMSYYLWIFYSNFAQAEESKSFDRQCLYLHRVVQHYSLLWFDGQSPQVRCRQFTNWWWNKPDFLEFHPLSESTEMVIHRPMQNIFVFILFGFSETFLKHSINGEKMWVRGGGKLHCSVDVIWKNRFFSTTYLTFFMEGYRFSPLLKLHKMFNIRLTLFINLFEFWIHDRQSLWIFHSPPPPTPTPIPL